MVSNGGAKRDAHAFRREYKGDRSNIGFFLYGWQLLGAGSGEGIAAAGGDQHPVSGDARVKQAIDLIGKPIIKTATLAGTT